MLLALFQLMNSLLIVLSWLGCLTATARAKQIVPVADAREWWKAISPTGFELVHTLSQKAQAEMASMDLAESDRAEAYRRRPRERSQARYGNRLWRKVDENERRILVTEKIPVFPSAAGAISGKLSNYFNDVYYIKVQLGNSANPPLNVQVDTGSSLFWVFCDDDNFPEQQKGTYSLTLSTTATFVCDSCDPRISPTGSPACPNNQYACPYFAAYADGSNSTGMLVMEDLFIGGSEVGRVLMGCQTEGYSLQMHTGDIANGTDGILGLARTKAASFAFPYYSSVLTSLASEGVIPNAFSVCLAQGDVGDEMPGGVLLLGTNHTFSNARTVDMIKSYYYFVPLLDIAIMGQRLHLDTRELNNDDRSVGVILDTGTVITRLPKAMLNSFIGLMDKQLLPLGFQRVEDDFYARCYDFSNVNDATLNNLTVYAEVLFVGSASIAIPEYQLFTPGGPNIACVTVANVSGGIAIIGATWMQDTFLTFDLNAGKISISHINCTTGQSVATIPISIAPPSPPAGTLTPTPNHSKPSLAPRRTDSPSTRHIFASIFALPSFVTLLLSLV